MCMLLQNKLLNCTEKIKESSCKYKYTKLSSQILKLDILMMSAFPQINV